MALALSLAGKTCIVTGAAAGLGKAIATTFLRAGANVVGCDNNIARLTTTTAELITLGTFRGIPADITSESEVQNLFAEAVKEFKKVDVLVNNAGILDNLTPLGEMEKGLWDRVMEVNITGAYITSRVAVNHMLSAEKPNGNILNVGSLASVSGFKAGAAYTSSKHALIGLTKNTSAFYSHKGIRCNAILPGMMLTDMSGGGNKSPAKEFNASGAEIVFKAIEAVHPGVCEVDDVANLALFLCSDVSRVVEGACISADKGWAAAM